MSAEPGSPPAATAPAHDGPAAERTDAPPPAGEPPAPDPTARRPPWRRLAPVLGALVAIVAAGIAYQTWQGSKHVEMDDASLIAPQVPLRSLGGGELKRVYVSIGDDVRAHRPVARVGNEVITSDVPGTVVGVRDDIGAPIPPGSVVAWLIDRRELRAVGLIDEDKGLADLRIGQRAAVKVDTWGSDKFFGTVDEISARPHRGDIAFSISNKDEARQYEVKVRFDGVPDPRLQQGMSASIKVDK